MRKFFQAHYFLLATALGLVALLSFKTVALAASVAGVDDSSSLLDLARPVFEAFSGGHYAYAAALAVIVMVAALRRYAQPKYAVLQSSVATTLMVLAASMATAMASALAAPGASVTWSLLESSALIGVGASGGFEVLKNLVIDPLLRPLMSKLPAWAQPIGRVFLWVFDGTGADQAALDASDKASKDAVAATPGQGIAAVIPTPPREIK